MMFINFKGYGYLVNKKYNYGYCSQDLEIVDEDEKAWDRIYS